MKTEKWNECSVKLPPNGLPVETMISDERGERNKQVLVRQNRLWFLEDKSMYVYYTPTHWREVETP